MYRHFCIRSGVLDTVHQRKPPLLHINRIAAPSTLILIILVNSFIFALLSNLLYCFQFFLSNCVINKPFLILFIESISYEDICICRGDPWHVNEAKGLTREDWMIYRGPGFFAVVWFGRLHALPLPPLPSESCLSFSVFLCVAGGAYGREKGEGVCVEPNQTTARKSGLL